MHDEVPSYLITAANSHASINTTITHQPLNSHLKLTGTSAHAPVYAHLPPAYEGRFNVIASNAHGAVGVDEDAQDPSGDGRVRKVDVKEHFGIINGEVSWVKKEEEGYKPRSQDWPVRSSVTLVSSWADVTLVL